MANALAYYNVATIMTEESFIVQTTGNNVLNILGRLQPCQQILEQGGSEWQTLQLGTMCQQLRLKNVYSTGNNVLNFLGRLEPCQQILDQGRNE